MPTLAEIEAALRARGPGRSPSGPHVGSATRRSAVLVPLYETDDGVHVVLTRRSPRMRTHTHEVAFPGGAAEPVDPDLWHTALREAEEEIALDRGLPRPIGELDRLVTVTSASMVQPYVAALPHRPSLVPDPREVESILHVSLAELMSAEAWREELWRWNDAPPRPITFFELVGDTVWGATASMIRQLLTVATGAAPPPEGERL